MEGKEVHFFSISEHKSEIHELQMEDIIFEREVHAGQIRKSDLLNFVRSTAPRNMDYVQMSLFDWYAIDFWHDTVLFKIIETGYL